MKEYYIEKLSAERLKICYEIAPHRVKQYLEAELNHVLDSIHANDLVLELGCGYGRILPALAAKARCTIGVDTSFSSLLLGRNMLSSVSNCLLIQMNAEQLSFIDRSFDVVVCIQNGISAFHADQKRLVSESIRVTKIGGTILFSSYSDKFWRHRLEWFRLQSEAGFLGEIDHDKTRNGVIVCKDGFTASTVGSDQFFALCSEFNVDKKIVEVDKSSLFCELVPRGD